MDPTRLAEELAGLGFDTSVNTLGVVEIEWVDGPTQGEVHYDLAHQLGRRVIPRPSECVLPDYVTTCLVDDLQVRLKRRYTNRAVGLFVLDELLRQGCRVEECPLNRGDTSRLGFGNVHGPQHAENHEALRAYMETSGTGSKLLERGAEYLAAVTKVQENSPAPNVKHNPRTRKGLHDIGHLEGLLQVTRAIDNTTRHEREAVA